MNAGVWHKTRLVNDDERVSGKQPRIYVGLAACTWVVVELAYRLRAAVR
jgi:hypothetical protein